MRLIKANESTAARRYVFFHLVDATDGITAETGESGGQPQVSSNGGAWTNTGIGTLTSIGNGRYYAELTQTLVQTAGTYVETRYKSANTAECPGDSVHVVGFDPNDGTSLGLSRIDAAISTRSTLDASGVWSHATRLLTAGTNIVLAKSTGITGFNDLDAAGIRAAIGMANSDLDTQLAALPTAGENADAVWDELMSGHSVSGSYGERILRARSTQAEVQVTGSFHVASDVHQFQPAVIDNAAFAADALAATNFAASVGQEFADAILGRNIAGGSDGGRMVKDALRFLRNRFAVSSGTLTVYQEDDTTAAWTATVTGDAAANPIVESNPA